MKLVVTDAGPVIHLAEAGVLTALSVLGDVIAPKAVGDEVRCMSSAHVWSNAVKIVDINSNQKQQAQVLCSVAGLHAGEAQAIVLAQSSDKSVFLTDDAAARLYASRLGIEVRGSLGLVLASAAKGVLEHAEAYDALHRLRRSSLWLSSAIFNEALVALDQIVRK